MIDSERASNHRKIGQRLRSDYERALLKSSMRSWTSEGLASPTTKYQSPPSAQVSVLKASFLLSEDPEFNLLNSVLFWNMNTEIRCFPTSNSSCAPGLCWK